MSVCNTIGNADNLLVADEEMLLQFFPDIGDCTLFQAFAVLDTSYCRTALLAIAKEPGKLAVTLRKQLVVEKNT